MKIKSLYLKYFRNIIETRFNLNSHFTVIIGSNGSGKSTLLDAVQIAASSFFLGLPYVRQRHVTGDKNTIIEATGYINDSGTFTWRRESLSQGTNISKKLPDVAQIKDIATSYSEALHNKNRPMLPIIAFYGVKQLGGKISRKKRIKKARDIIKDGYAQALDAPSDKAIFTQWFYYYQEHLEDDLEFVGTYESVIEAIETAIPYLTNVSFDSFRLELVADFKTKGQLTNRLHHSMMSDGIKRMLGIVADIAYRCIVLNGFRGKDAVKETSGVITIDNLDFHLHPNWQRHVISNLKDAFPKIQFVVTTHSPFIVQSLESDELINLDRISDVKPKDLSLEEVAEVIMGVEDIPRSAKFMEMQEVAEKYFTLIKEGKTSETSKTAATLRSRLNKLEERFADDPAFVAALKIERNAKGL